mgnify:CR=1 FL=1
MLGNRKSGFGSGGSTTLIAHETVIVGDIHFSGSLDVEGVIRGSIVAEAGADALVRVVEKGRVEGEIRAPSVMINGTVKGDVYSSAKLELAPKGRVQGNVHYTLLEMAAGSEVNGSLTHNVDGQEAPAKAETLADTGQGRKPRVVAAPIAKVD